MKHGAILDGISRRPGSLLNANQQQYIVPALRSTFDDTIAAINSAMSAGCIEPARSSEAGILVLSGWGSMGGQHFLLATGPNDAGIDPLKLIEHDGELLVLGMRSIPDLEAAGLDLAMLDDQLDQKGHRFFQEFRKQEPFANIGGQLQLTTIRPDSIEGRVFGYWPDWIGKPIDPARKFVPVL